MHYIRLMSIIHIRILSDPMACDELEKKIKDLNERDRFLDINNINSINFLKGNVVSIISGFKTEVGSLLAYSESAPDFFGYKRNEFESLSSINDICPQCISIWHDHFIMRLVESGKSRIIRRYRVAISKTKEGFIFPINIYVNYFWHIHNDFCFSGIILKLKTSSIFLLTDNKGVI